MLVEINATKEFCLRNCFECPEFLNTILTVEIKNERNAPRIGEVHQFLEYGVTYYCLQKDNTIAKRFPQIYLSNKFQCSSTVLSFINSFKKLKIKFVQ